MLSALSAMLGIIIIASGLKLTKVGLINSTRLLRHYGQVMQYQMDFNRVLIMLVHTDILSSNPSLKKLMCFTAQLDKLMDKLTAYSDAATIDELKKKQESIQHMLDAIGYKTKGGDRQSECSTVLIYPLFD